MGAFVSVALESKLGPKLLCATGAGVSTGGLLPVRRQARVGGPRGDGDGLEEEERDGVHRAPKGEGSQWCNRLPQEMRR